MTEVVKLPTEAVWVLGFYHPVHGDRRTSSHFFPWPIDGLSHDQDEWNKVANFQSKLVQCPMDNLYGINDSWHDSYGDMGNRFIHFGWRIHKKDKRNVVHGWNWNVLKLGRNIGKYVKINQLPAVPLPPVKWLPFKVLEPHYISEASPHFNVSSALYRQWSTEHPEPAGTFVMDSRANDLISGYIKTHVTNGILETVETIFHHWEHHAEMGDRYNPEIVANEQNRERITQLNQSDSQTPKRNAEIARIEYLEVKEDLKKTFSTAKTMTQTLSACARYLEGEFGEDWHVRGYWHPERSPWHAKEEKKRLDEQHDLQHLHRMGFLDNHFETSTLKPLFRRFPKLARLYGIPTNNLPARPKPTVIVDGTDWKDRQPRD